MKLEQNKVEMMNVSIPVGSLILTTNTEFQKTDELYRNWIADNQMKVDQISDGYHTFLELYDFRKVYNAVLFNEWASTHLGIVASARKHFKNSDEYIDAVKYNVHKSWRHSDGELCFGGGWFIVSAMLPDGLISNHYKAEDWDLFRIPEADKARYEFDGHTSQDVLERLKNL